MTGAALGALMSHWRRQPLQLATLVLGLALATGLWSAVQAINAEARASYDKANAQLGNDAGRFLSAPDGRIDLATYIRLRRAGWQVTPVLEGRIRLGGETVTVMGVDFLNYPVLPAPGADMAPASLPEILGTPGRLFVDPETAAHIGADAAPVPMILSDQVPPGVVITDIGVAERLLERTGQISRLLVLPDQPPGLTPLGDLVPGLRLEEPATDTASLTDSFRLNLTAFGFLSFAVGLFIVHGTIGLAFQQRRGIFRTLRALGLPQRRLTLLVLGELLALALVAGALGLVIGYLVAAALLPDVAATLRGLYGAPVTGSLTLRPLWFAGGLGMALSGALVAGAQGLWQLSSLPILDAPGAQSWSAASARKTNLMALGGVALIGAGLASVALLDGLIAGFALLAGLLLGAALMLPAALGAVLAFASSRATGVVAQWVWADMRTQLPGLSLALMALLLALATNIGVGTMVSSFRLTFAGWLDQRLASELYVTAASDAQGVEITRWLEDGRADAVLPIRHVQVPVLGRPAQIYGIIDHQTYRDNWPVLAAQPDMWDRVARGQGVLINEQLARRADLWPGDTIALTPDWTAEIAGVYSDYGNTSGQVIVSLDTLLARFAAVPNRQFGIRVSPQRAAALAGELRERFDLPVSAIIDQAGIKALSLGIFENTFIVTGALNVLTLGVASFAILTSLLTLWSMRLPQLAPVWAMGLTRARLARLEMARSLALAALTAVLALPLGLGLAWVLLSVINVEAFGWRLPMYLFPADWLILGALALLAGGIAALIPARRLQKVPPSDLLKVFANER